MKIQIIVGVFCLAVSTAQAFDDLGYLLALIAQDKVNGPKGENTWEFQSYSDTGLADPRDHTYLFTAHHNSMLMCIPADLSDEMALIVYTNVRGSAEGTWHLQEHRYALRKYFEQKMETEPELRDHWKEVLKQYE